MRVGISHDLLDSSGRFSFGERPIEILEAARDRLSWEMLPAGLQEVTPDLTSRYDALYVNTPRLTARSLAGEPRTRLVARHGVGFDSVDVDALTSAGVILTNTPFAVRRPVATMALTFMLALAQRLLEKDKLTRTGRWNERNDFMGVGLTGRALGLVGAGGIGRELVRLVQPFHMRILASDPHVDPAVLSAEGIEPASLETVFAEADFIVVACLLTRETHHLVSRDRLRLMKPGAFLINVARGPIVDEAALIEVLHERRIAGAALDVFEREPVETDNPLLSMPNVIVTPHALCWTDENFGAIARDAMTSIVDTLSRRRPTHVVNPASLDHSRWRGWFKP